MGERRSVERRSERVQHFLNAELNDRQKNWAERWIERTHILLWTRLERHVQNFRSKVFKIRGNFRNLVRNLTLSFIGKLDRLPKWPMRRRPRLGRRVSLLSSVHWRLRAKAAGAAILAFYFLCWTLNWTLNALGERWIERRVGRKCWIERWIERKFRAERWIERWTAVFTERPMLWFGPFVGQKHYLW